MNGRVYDPALGRFLSADPHVQDPRGSQSYNRYSYVHNNPLRYNDPSGYFVDNLFRELGEFFQTDAGKAVGVVLAVWGGYAAYGAASTGAVATTTTVASSGTAAYSTAVIGASSVTAGLAAGGAAFGGIAGAAYGVSQTGTPKGLVKGAAVGALSGYTLGSIAGGFVGAGMAQGAEGIARSLAHHAANYYAREEAREIAMRNDLSLTEFSAGLLVLSGIGNGLVGSRYRNGSYMIGSGNDLGTNGIEGFLSRQGGIISNTAAARGVGLLFDVTDAILAYQGIPTASGWHAAIVSDRGPLSGHSLGGIDVSNLYGLGLTSHARIEALPFGNIAGSDNVIVQRGDPISGSWLWWLFNPGARTFSHSGQGMCIHTWDCGFGAQ